MACGLSRVSGGRTSSRMPYRLFEDEAESLHASGSICIRSAEFSAILEHLRFLTMLSASELDMSVRLGLLAAGHYALYYWTRYIVAPAKTSQSRFMRASVLMPLFPFLASLFCAKRNEEFTAALYCVCVFMWLTPFKICTFCMNRGQLVKAYESGSDSAFALGLLFPITIAFNATRVPKETEEEAKERHAYKDARFSVARFEKDECAKEALSFLTHVVAKITFMVGLRYGRHRFGESGHLFWRDVCFGWYFYANTSVVEDAIGLFVLFALKLKLEPNFDRPWLSRSLKELWSRRYNVVFGTILRDTVYDPICEDCWVRGTKYFDRKTPSKLRKSTALFATFVVSGIMHIFVPRFVYMSKLPFLSGLFFPVNGAIILLEELLKHVFSTNKVGLKILGALPSWLCQIYVIITMFALGHYFFLPECVEGGYSDALMEGGLAFLPRN